MKKPREGFTTGSAATAAACAAVELLLAGRGPSSVTIPLPPFDDRGRPEGRLAVAVEQTRREANGALARVIKDGGDDPDATHKAAIDVHARLDPALPPLSLRIEGGRGVGRATLPGLPVPVGEAAINPVPREQMRRAVLETLERLGAREAAGLVLTVSVPDGERIARRTLNPRLGIVGGISILGTHGIVRPYSHDAWKQAIILSLDVALAARADHPPHEPALCLSTGRRSERLLMARYPDLDPLFFIQAADYAAFSLKAAAERGFIPLAWGCFFGKLAKLAQGLSYTHARSAPLDMAWIARRAGGTAAREIAACVTAGHALEILLALPQGPDIVRGIAATAGEQARKFAGAPVIIHLFHQDGRELVTA